MRLIRLMSNILLVAMIVFIISCEKNVIPIDTTSSCISDIPSVTTEAPAPDNDPDEFLAGKYRLNTKIIDLTASGIEVSEGSDISYLFDDDLSTVFSAAIDKDNSIV